MERKSAFVKSVKTRFENNQSNMAIVHHHLLFQAKVDIQPGSLTEGSLFKFMKDLLVAIDMKCLIEPRLKLSHQNAWTGLMGIITSHIAFHYWVDEQYVQLDIYTCKKFDKEKALSFLQNFWKAKNGKALFIDRAIEKGFKIERIDF